MAGSIISDYESACRYLLERKSRGVSLDLDRMKRFVEAIGHPERRVPCIHVAGTNGKGSVAAMLEAMLRSAGWRTGLYSSPHLVRLGERIQVNRELLSERELVAYVRELEPTATAQESAGGRGFGPSYFEFMTGMALLHFARSECDIAVVEVGLGGRLDATNVVLPKVSAITSIGLDHGEFLGNTLTSVATEKAGIIKSDKPVVIGRLPGEAESVIRGMAKERNSRVHSVLEAFGPNVEQYPASRLEGAYQRINAATATLVARVLSPHWRLSDEVITQGLATVAWPGRWQRFSVGERVVILDCAHNAEGATALEANLRATTQEFGKPPIVVVGVLGMERARPLMEVICRHAVEIHLVQPAQSRACTYAQLEGLIPASFEKPTVRNTVGQLFPAAGVCTVGKPGEVVIVTGSVSLAGEVLARLEPGRGTYEGHLQDF